MFSVPATTAEVVVERVGQPDCFILDQFPAGMKTTNIITDIPGEKSVFPALDFLLKALAVVSENRLLVGESITAR